MFESKDPNIVYSVDNKVLIVHINRPEKKNALLPGMYRALGDSIRLADESDSINAVLFRGMDDCFTSGNDVSGFVGEGASTEDRPSVYFMHALNESKVPLIAAVSGLAIGIGTTMLFHCDLVYASENCFLQLPFTRLGVCPEAGSSYLLPKQIGYQRAAELMLLGERFTAAKAYEYGIVNEVLAQEETLEKALAKAHDLAALPAESVQTSKRLMKKSQLKELPDIIDEELEEFGRLLQTPDAQAIMQAFMNRKKSA